MTNRPVKRQKGTKRILKQIKMEAKQANLWDTISLEERDVGQIETWVCNLN